MTTLIGWALGLVGAYVVIAGITYLVMRYALKATREEARSYALAWGRTIYVGILRVLGK